MCIVVQLDLIECEIRSGEEKGIKLNRYNVIQIKWTEIENEGFREIRFCVNSKWKWEKTKRKSLAKIASTSLCE